MLSKDTDKSGIQYSKEELSEIERIIKIIPGGPADSSTSAPDDIMSLKPEEVEEYTDSADSYDEEIESSDEPEVGDEDFDLGAIPEDLLAEDLSEPSDSNELAEGEDDSTEEFEDISSLLEEVQDNDEILPPDEDFTFSEDFNALQSDDEALPLTDDSSIDEDAGFPQTGLDAFDEIDGLPDDDNIEPVVSPAVEESEDISDLTDDLSSIDGLDNIDGIGDINDLDSGDFHTNLEDISTDGVDLPPIDNLEEPAKYVYKPKNIKPKFNPKSTLGEIYNLLNGEPEAVEEKDIAAEAFSDETVGLMPDDVEPMDLPTDDDSMTNMSLDSFDGAEDIGSESSDLSLGLDDLPADDSMDMPSFGDDEKELSLSSSDEEIPDLNSLAVDNNATFGEADLDDLPDMSFGDDSPGELPGIDDMSDLSGDTGFDTDYGDIDTTPVTEDAFSETPVDQSMAEDLTAYNDNMDIPGVGEDEYPDIPDLKNINLSGAEHDIDDSYSVEDISDYEEESPETANVKENEPAELTDAELKKLKKGLLLLPPGLVAAVKDVILKDKLSPKDTRLLVSMIIDGRPEDNIHRFLEKKLNKKIDKDSVAKSRKVLTSRNAYTKEGRERQKRLIKKTKIFGIIGIAAITASILSYEYIYKPFMAKKYINEGVALIRRVNEPKFMDYKEAEDLFVKVDTDYVKDFIYGYLNYGKAYFDRKEYFRSLQKYNKAFDINPKDAETLNSLGYFYSKPKDDKFKDFFEKSVKLNLDNYYFNKVPALTPVKTQLDLAIDFYTKALNLDPKNLSSLLGIGNAYFYQGQFLKARTYYEEMLKIDPNSIAANSGLLNLFIEKDNFPEALKIYVDLRDKDLLHEVPSALLGKLAYYLLGKSKSENVNIRIDYGIQSPRLKDDSDNPFPAVKSVLDSLRKRDADYPPLYLLYAVLSIKEKNLQLAESYLKTAVDKADSANQKFFEADHYMGEFLYYTKDPVGAYKYFNKAIDDLKNPPDFTFDEYYKPIVMPGRTYAMMGNIFYYFFDKVVYRTGDQESVNEQDMVNTEEVMANFNIAQNKYEKALEHGFETSELHYNLGRIYYLNKLYEKARDQWLNLYDSFTTSPEMMLSLGNVFYKLGNYDTAKSQFMKLISVYENESAKINSVILSNNDHIKVYQTLSTAYNNLGAVYHMQSKDSESGICYWKAVDNSAKIMRENEFARVNLSHLFKVNQPPVDPILDDNLPYSINVFQSEMRW